MKLGHIVLYTVLTCFCLVLSLKGPKDELQTSFGTNAISTDIVNDIRDVGEDNRGYVGEDNREYEGEDNSTVNNKTSDLTSKQKVDDTSDKTNSSVNSQDDTTVIALTERIGGRRLGSSRYKNGRQQVSINDLTLSEDVPRHGALMHKNLPKYDTKTASNKGKGDSDPSTGAEAGDNSFKKKRRIPASTATPSIQIAFLVIGAVLGAVLLTGFIRWRVRGRLNAAKQAEDKAANKDSNSEMVTIYESDGEDSASSMESDVSDEEDSSTLDEITSHRFDIPLSLMSQTYTVGNNARFLSKSSKCSRDLGINIGSTRRSMCRKKRGNKYRYMRHQRKRLENMYVQKLETIPMENSVPTNEADKSGNKEATNGQQTLRPPQPPLLSARRGSPGVPRSVMASLLNTWRSLSFNRDWVGKMWQEQHNIRRISDVLRGMSSRRSSESERSSRESLSSDSFGKNDRERPKSRFSVITEVDLSGLDSNLQESASVHNISEINIVIDSASDEETMSRVEERDDVSCSGSFTTTTSASSDELIDNSATFDPNRNTSDSRVRSHSNVSSNQWSFHDEPPEYESLLASEASRSNDGHSRYQRRHARQWLEDWHRPSLYTHGNVCNVNAAENLTVSSRLRDARSNSPHSYIHHRQPMEVDNDGEEAASTSTQHGQPEITVTEERITGDTVHTNLPTDASTSAMAAPFPAKEGVVIEQLSDGAQIVYIPPPEFPPYHNDSPPRYKK